MKIIAVLRGLVLNPLLVGFARDVLESAAMAAILLASDATFLDGVVPESLKVYIPLIVMALRTTEAAADKIDPAKQRRRDALREADTTGPLQPGDVQ